MVSSCTQAWSIGNTFSGVINHVSLPGSTMEGFVSGRCQENAAWWSACANCKVGWRDFSQGLGPSVAVMGNVNATSYRNILDNCMLFLTRVQGRPFPVPA